MSRNLENIKPTSNELYKVLVAVVCELYSVFALKSILSIFNNDAHNIVSKKGWEILNNK